ncbi:MAG TPA: hypothetical protein VGQ31_06535 [Candidatus Limnocylindrales bacterium]|nr:hypothetical protein [Candidatus Limnocylindrales bacterium]
MTGSFAGRDGHDIDALVTDRYLEALLAAHARGADHGPSAATPDDPIRRTADRLASDLPRFHPSFRFEEALAARLAEAAARMRGPARLDGSSDALVALPAIRRVASGDPSGLAGEAWPDRRRPLLIGGALTSAALSVAGAVYVAWRLNRPAAGPMVRAARAVARSRAI